MNAHLETYVEHKLIAEWAAERIDQEIDNEAKKQEIADAFIERQSDFLDEVLQRAKNPQGKILYQAPAKADTPMPGTPGTKVQTFLRLIKENDWLKFALATAAISLCSGPGFFLIRGIGASAMWAYHGIARVTRRHPGLQSAGMTSTTAPFQITNAVYGDHNKLELHWPSQGAGYTYRIFANCHPEVDGNTPFPVDDRSITSTGARVNMDYDENCLTPQIQVMAILPSGAAGPMTDPVVFRLSPLNNARSVEPIAIEAESKTAVIPKGGRPENRPSKESASGSLSRKEPHLSPPSRTAAAQDGRLSGQPPSAVSRNPAPRPSFLSALAHNFVKNSDGVITSAIPLAPAAQGVVAVKDAAVASHDEAAAKVALPPAVVNLRGERVGHTVRMTWDSPGTEVHYNVYVAYATNHPVFDTGNDTPLNGPVITWSPPSEGTQVFELYLKAVDAQGREGPASNHIIADLR